MKNQKIIVIIVFLVALVILSAALKFFGKPKRPSYNYVAVISHTEMLGIDASTEYIYYIYPISESNNDEYFYIKSKSTTTIRGSSSEKDVKTGRMRKKKDLEKINLDIKIDNQSNAKTIIGYSYINNGNSEKCSDMNELADKLFSEEK